jgi:hypothetical protein
MAQELSDPALMSRTGASPGISTRVGVATLLAIELMPSCPLEFSPQQYAESSVLIAHA